MNEKIAVMLGSDGTTCGLHGSGRLIVFSRQAGEWRSVGEKAFYGLAKPDSASLRKRASEIVEFLGDCRMLIGCSISGLINYELQKNDRVLWEADGNPECFLDTIARLESEAREEEIQEQRHATLMNATALKTVAEGSYSISLKDIQDQGVGVSSKQILRPFLRQRKFRELEVVCSHIPRWLETDLREGFEWESEVIASHEVRVRIINPSFG